MPPQNDKPNVLKELDQLEEWLKSLTPLDQTNFVALLNLPNGLEVIANLPSGKYKSMAVMALAIRQLPTELEVK